MKKVVKAQITWITHENGGRKNPPLQGTRYCPIIFDAMDQNKMNSGVLILFALKLMLK